MSSTFCSIVTKQRYNFSQEWKIFAIVQDYSKKVREPFNKKTPGMSDLLYLAIFNTETCSETSKNLFICLIWRASQHWVFTDQIKIRVSDWARPPLIFGPNLKFCFFKGFLIIYVYFDFCMCCYAFLCFLYINVSVNVCMHVYVCICICMIVLLCCLCPC